MKKIYFLFLLFFSTSSLVAQVGINTTDPKAQLEIKSSSETTPTNTDGLLIPKVNAFPVTNPTIDQQGMLVYLKNASGSNQPGFYYWDFATLVWKPIAGATASGTLDQAYDSGGAGLGKTITADAGAVLIDGTDGLVSTGTLGSGTSGPSGPGVKMFWNPRKAAFRAGSIYGGEWDDINIGERSTAFGENAIASGSVSTAFGHNTTASDSYATAFGYRTSANGLRSTAFGYVTTANGTDSTSFGSSTRANGEQSTAFGHGNFANGVQSTAFGVYTKANGIQSTTFGSNNKADGDLSTAFGFGNFAPSYGEIALGIGATEYTTSTNGATQFRIENATDRLFVIGNAIDTNSFSGIQAAERSDAIIILKNGLTRLPSITNAMIDASDGKAVITKEYLQSNSSTWGLTGNTGTGTTNFIGTTDNQNFNIRTNNITRARILPTGEVGIGTTTPDRKLEVSGTGDQFARITTTGTANVGMEFKRSGAGSDWQIRNDAGLLLIGQSGDDLATVTDIIRVGGGSFTPATDNSTVLGQSTRRWTAVHAINGVIQTSDANDKKQMLPLTQGLDKIKSLRPISFQWKDDTIDKSSTHLGFVAQEVQQVLPEIVVDHEWIEVPDTTEKVWKKQNDWE